MLIQLLLGSAVITLSIFIQVVFIYLAVTTMSRLGQTREFKSQLFTMTYYLGGVAMWLLLAFSLICWSWAVVFYGLNLFSTLEESLYLSMVAFTSLGFGDVVLSQDWRLLSGMIAANGLLIFGLNTAILVETLRQILLRFSSSSSA